MEAINGAEGDSAQAECAPVRSEPPFVGTMLYLHWQVWPDGREETRDEWMDTQFWWETPPPACEASVVRTHHEERVLQLHVNGLDHDQVRKVFTESKARIKAHQQEILERLVQGQGTSQF